MVKFFKKKKPTELYSPVVGQSIRLEDVPDPMFSKKMLGDGVAFIFDGDTVYSPCDAKVILFVDTRHAIGLDANGIEILLHVGIDTVTLQGKGFKALVAVGNHVKKGEPMLKIDRTYLKEQNADLTTMMIITTKNVSFKVKDQGIVDLNTPVILFENKE